MLTFWAPQNDRLNLSFVKYNYVDGGKLARNGRKMAIFVSLKFWWPDTMYLVATIKLRIYEAAPANRTDVA